MFTKVMKWEGETFTTRRMEEVEKAIEIEETLKVRIWTVLRTACLETRWGIPRTEVRWIARVR